MVSLSFGVFDLGFLYEFLMDFNNFLFVIKLNFRSFVFWSFFVPSATIKNTICWCICRSSIYIRELQSALPLWMLNECLMTALWMLYESPMNALWLFNEFSTNAVWILYDRSMNVLWLIRLTCHWVAKISGTYMGTYFLREILSTWLAHNFLNMYPFLMIFVPFESWEWGLSNDPGIIKNGSVYRRLQTRFWSQRNWIVLPPLT